MQDQGNSIWYEAFNLLSDASNHDSAGAEFKDWRMPTNRELRIIWYVKDIIGAYSSSTPFTYWSSTEKNSIEAYANRFDSSFNSQIQSKSNSYYVRAVRAF